MKNSKHVSALFYVTLILLLKVGGLHALTHHDADETDVHHCEVCIVETVINLTPLIESETPVLPQAEFYFSERELINYTLYVALNKRYLESYHSTRPPPQFL